MYIHRQLRRSTFDTQTAPHLPGLPHDVAFPEVLAKRNANEGPRREGQEAGGKRQEDSLLCRKSNFRDLIVLVTLEIWRIPVGNHCTQHVSQTTESYALPTIWSFSMRASGVLVDRLHNFDATYSTARTPNPFSRTMAPLEYMPQGQKYTWAFHDTNLPALLANLSMPAK